MLAVLFQAISGFLMQGAGPGWTNESVSRYFRGDEVSAETSSPITDTLLSDDSAFGMTDDNFDPHTDNTFDETDFNVPSIALPKEFNALVEVAHWHLAMLPLLIFLAAHCAALTRFGKKPLLIILGAITGIGGIGVIATPFLIRYISGIFAPVQISSVILLDSGLIILSIITLFACLFTGRHAKTKESTAKISER